MARLQTGDVNRNPAVTRTAGIVFGIGLGAAMGIGETQRPLSRFEHRVVYVRP